jgi:hypothetical protein
VLASGPELCPPVEQADTAQPPQSVSYGPHAHAEGFCDLGVAGFIITGLDQAPQVKGDLGMGGRDVADGALVFEPHDPVVGLGRS